METLNPKPKNTIHTLVNWRRCCAPLQTEELRATVDSLKEMVRHLDKGKGIAAAPAEPGIGVDDLRSELHAFATTLSE